MHTTLCCVSPTIRQALDTHPFSVTFHPVMNQLAEGLLWYTAFLFSTTLHEAAHGLAALKLGDRTAYDAGQVTLDPLPHLRREPVGTIVVPILSFLYAGWMIGWASVPYNFQWALAYPKRAAWMSVAGPAANLGLVMFTALMIRAGMAFGIFLPPDMIDATHVVAATGEGAIATAATFLNILFSLNLLLFLFNLLPVPPLDGSGAVPFLLSEERGRTYLGLIRRSPLALIGLLVAWKVFDYVYAPIHVLCVNLLYLGAAHYQ
jgi:Zn-dependent protease